MSQFRMRQKFLWQAAVSVLSHDTPDSLLSNKKMKIHHNNLTYSRMNYCKNLSRCLTHIQTIGFLIYVDPPKPITMAEGSVYTL